MAARAWLALFIAACAAVAHAQSSVFIDELTSPELAALVRAGRTTALVPIGGTEQSGPHIVLGKHNVRARVLSGKIAGALGNALVAPVIAYVPEGSIHPPAAHMRFTGTISIPEPVFEAMLEATARSFKQHGFRDVVFLGDHGGYQKSEERVAAKLNREWAADKTCRAHALLDYYRITQTAYVKALKERGYSEAEIGTHAGLADTALALAVDNALVRGGALGVKPSVNQGVHGDPRRASRELGQLGVQQIVESSVSAIRALAREH
jgi:creatinine amidohydrolase/Fe(II)-dependent formamide hydrolase-like protein